MSPLGEASAGLGLGGGLDGAHLATTPLPLLGLLAALALAPFAVVMLTSFSKIAVVLGLLRSALGTQQAPPTVVLTGLAAVLTAHAMAPTAGAMVEAARGPGVGWSSGPELAASIARVSAPLRAFLVKHGDPAEREQLASLGRELRPVEDAPTVSPDDTTVVVAAFVLTELREAFVLGFLLFLPFLLLDMLVANVLLALGMQTLTPTQVSLPFKVLLFISIDGWSLLSRGLLLGYR